MSTKTQTPTPTPTPTPSDVARERPVFYWGRGGQLRACRDYLGFDATLMAGLLKMKRRTLQSMESGRDPIPAGVWTDVRDLLDRFEDEVDELADRIEAGELPQVEVAWEADRWRRHVIARAWGESHRVADVLTPDDRRAREEMQE